MVESNAENGAGLLFRSAPFSGLVNSRGRCYRDRSEPCVSVLASPSMSPTRCSWRPATQASSRAAGTGLPASLSDHSFWQLSVDASEPNGYFRSENLTSNELQFQYVIPDLERRIWPGNVYLGVGPEQNFTYIAAVKPAMAVIFDIRRGNLLLHLMYKALFE